MSDLVPDGWTRKKLCEIVELQYGKSPKYILDESGEFPVCGTGGITGFTKLFLYDGESIIIGRKGTLDQPKYIKGRFWAIDTTYYVSSFKNHCPKWFFYHLLIANLNKFNEATGVPSLSRKALYNISINVPKTRSEQEKIASILTSVDTVIEKTEAQINKLKDLKKAMTQELLSKGIGHTEFKDSPAGKIPRSWNIKPLEEIAKFNSGNAFKSHQLTELGTKIIRISNLHNPNFPFWNYTGEIKKSWVVNDGDILFSWAGVENSINIHRYKGETALLNQHIYNFKFENEVIKEWTFQYIKFFLPSLRKSIEGGAGQLHLTKSKIQEIPIPIPARKEMNSLLNAFVSLDDLTEYKLGKRNCTKSLKKALMQDLLTGKVRVN